MSKVYVTLWFDTEDYITPESDLSAGRLADLLTRLSIPGTFKVVGEKARVLERRGRKEVIHALRRHDIGYHTDFHSVHPTVAEYLKDLGWEEGVDEFDRRERSGLKDVERIFGLRCSCYGQAGASWAPQVYEALQRWHIPTYLDDGGHIGLEDQPHRFCGILNIFRLRQSTTRLHWTGEEPLTSAQAQFETIYKRLKQKGGGLISIYYHPLEWATQGFWDGVNFARGANPPREQWRPAPLLPPEERERRFQWFEEYLLFIARHPEVQFITARQMPQIYADQAQGRWFSPQELAQVAESLAHQVSFCQVGEVFLSPAEALLLLCEAISSPLLQNRFPEGAILNLSPLGPKERRGIIPQGEVEVTALVQSVGEVAEYLRKYRCIPSSIRVKNWEVAPAVFLATLARVAESYLRREGLRETVEWRDLPLVLEEQVGADERVWNWVIFPEGFRAPRLLELARLQCWTLKPAVPVT